MFAKPYKLKSNTTLKNSEKKHLSQRIQDAFPAATDVQIKQLVPAKSGCTCMKVILHLGDTVNVYVVDSVPMMIETEERLLPTVCALWKVPDLVPVIVIHSLVLSKVQGGAPLYLPGVVTPAGGAGFPLFQRNTVIALCTEANTAAGIIGKALMSSADMLLLVAGVCLETYHVVGDQLCKDNKFNKIERPKLGVASYSQGDVTESITAEVSQLRIQPPPVKEEWPALGRPAPRPPPQVPQVITPEPEESPTVINEPRLIDDSNNCGEIVDLETNNIKGDSQESDQPSIPSDPDGLLRWCLLSYLKLDGKTLELPFKTNLLYKNMMGVCPADRTVDVKKSTHKKVGKFLEAMQQEGLLEVREVERGVSALTAVHWPHPALRRHAVPRDVRTRMQASAEPQGAADYVPPAVREVYCVTAAVSDVLAQKKHVALSASEVRACVARHVRARGLSEARGAVAVDAPLAALAGAGAAPGDAVRWEALLASVLARMTPATEMRFSDGTVRLTKTKLEPVRMQVANRSGNKKVTLVSNLESFGFSLLELGHVCQTGVAASCGVTRTPGSKCDQLMIQGDQTHFVAKLLIEKYGLPKKYVEGADKALNKKK